MSPKSTIGLLILFLAGCSSVPHAPLDGPAYSERHLELQKWNRTSGCCTAQGKTIAVSSGGQASTAIGMEIARQGGNAVDVAVAVAFGLAVERPQSCGIGGGGFMMLKLAQPQTTLFVDFRETAPHLAKKDMYLDGSGKVIAGASVWGPLAVGTPGFVAGLWEVHQKWGKLPWKDVLTPSVSLAREGFLVYPTLGRALGELEDRFKANVYTRKIFFRNGKLLQVGDKLVQKDLANTIEALAKGGRDEFYKGRTAERIVNVMKQYGALLSAKDLEHYEIQLRQPVAWQWNGYTFLGAPPPSAGGILFAQIMKVLQGFDLGKESASTGSYVHLLAEVMKRAYADRSLHIGDPAFYGVPQAKLISDDYAEAQRDKIDLSEATPSSKVAPATLVPEDKGTTHLSVMDDQGNAIGVTLTINGPFGSGIVVPRTGIVLNNEMDDFSVKAGEKNLYGLTGGEANSVAPGKRPVSSMSPTVVLKDGSPVLVVGGAGGSRIISSVLQVTLNYLAVFPGDLKKAMFAPRMHHQWLPDRLDLEDGYPSSAVDWLKERKHSVAVPSFSAKVHAVARNSNGTLTAVFDPRDLGGAEAK